MNISCLFSFVFQHLFQLDSFIIFSLVHGIRPFPRMPRKVKLVSNDERKRAIYSCDRCKQRKRACRRFKDGAQQFDNKTPCVQCSKSGAQCITSIPRKKRATVASTKYHLDCLTRIVGAMFPESDPNSVEDIKGMAKALHVGLPLPSNKSDADVEGETVFKTFDSEESDSAEGDNTSKTNSHAAGHIKTGDTTVFNALLEFSQVDNNDGDTEMQVPDHEKVEPETIPTLRSAAGPDLLECLLISIVPEKEAVLYADNFFKRVHPSYFVFNESAFRSRQRLFFSKVLPNVGNNTMTHDFNIEEICSMYLVWIIGRNSMVSGLSQSEIIGMGLVSESALDNYVNLINVCISDFIFSSSIHSVRVLYLAGLYYETKKNRDAAWLLWNNSIFKSISLGFHRNSIVNKLEPELQEEIRVVFWSIFRLQVNNCSMLGRYPNFSLQEIDLDLPKMNFVQDDLFKGVYLKSVSMMKIMYEILKNREYLVTHKNPWSQENVDNVLRIQRSMIYWQESLTDDLKNYRNNEPKRYQIKLHLQFNYVFMSLCLPYLVEFGLRNRKNKVKMTNPLLGTMCYAIKSAIEITKVVLFSAQCHLFNGLLYFDLYYAYSGLMVLLLAHTVAKDKSSKKGSANYSPLLDELEATHSVNFQMIMDSIVQIKDINKKYENQTTMGIIKETSERINLLLRLFKLNNESSPRVAYLTGPRAKPETARQLVGGPHPGSHFPSSILNPEPNLFDSLLEFSDFEVAFDGTESLYDLLNCSS